MTEQKKDSLRTINDQAKIADLLQKLQASILKIQPKDSNQMLTYKFVGANTPSSFFVEAVDGSQLEGPEFVVNLNFENEKYFFKCKILNKNITNYELSFPHEIFQMHQREHFRIYFQKELNYSATIKRNVIKEKFVLIDLSAGGCRIEFPDKLDPNDFQNFNIDLNVGTITFMGVPAKKIDLYTEQNRKFMGVQFLVAGTATEGQLFAALIDLYRKHGKK